GRPVGVGALASQAGTRARAGAGLVSVPAGETGARTRTRLPGTGGNRAEEARTRRSGISRSRVGRSRISRSRVRRAGAHPAAGTADGIPAWPAVVPRMAIQQV